MKKASPTRANPFLVAKLHRIPSPSLLELVATQVFFGIDAEASSLGFTEE
jgi:hypothetical protein